MEVSVERGSVSRPLQEEFPGLGLTYALVDARDGRSPRGVRERLRYLSNRMHGRRALHLRQEPVASAYRVFYRQIGLDPDEIRTPIEATVLERLRAGGFRSHGLVEDALTIGIVETGVAMRALDAASIRGRLGIRLAGEGERLGGSRTGVELDEGTIVLADEQRALAFIFGDTAPEAEVGRTTERLALCAVQVQGVPAISVEEAIWASADALGSAIGPS